MTHLTALVTAALLSIPAALPAPALAKTGDVVRRGSCSHSATWKLKASPDDGRIEVEGEVDSNAKGQTWKWKLRHDGSVSARGTATTSGPSGSFAVRRKVVDVKGADHLRFTARNPKSDETCRGSLTF